MKELFFWKEKDIKEKLNERTGKKKFILNFLNSHDIYQFKAEPLFREALSPKETINSIDGFIVSLYLSLKYFKKIARYTGPCFTQDFFKNKKLSFGKKHFFIGPEESDLKKLANKFEFLDEKKIFSYNPPYIKGIDFSEEEIKKIIEKIIEKRPDYVWVCIGCPKQCILTYRIFKKTSAKIYFNVGAALDFILGKKKEAPLFFRKLGIEWLYRLITDFKYSKRKVWRSFIALKYLGKNIKLKSNLK